MQTQWTDMVNVIPEGQLGKARTRHFEISAKEAGFTAMRAVITGVADASIKPGRYVQLFVGSSMMMSDTQMERRSNMELIWNARGHVLVAGLGVGMVVPPLLAKPEVTRVTIVEKSKDVIGLVEGPLRAFLGEKASKLEIVVGDIFDWKPPTKVKYDTVYFDIWPEINTDNLKEMETLHKKYARRRNPEGWMGSWKREYLRMLKNTRRYR